MTAIIHPITDETAAERAIELFLAGYDPLLYAADLGVTPEQVWNQIRVTLQIYVDKALAAEEKLRRPRAGRPPLGKRAMTNAEKVARYRARKAAKQDK